MSTYEARVRLRRVGLALDRIRPGWAPKINRDCLDMSDPESCFFGQLWGHFNDSPKYLRRHAIKLGVLSSIAERLPFIHPAVRHLAETAMQEEYRSLTFVANELIDERLPRGIPYSA